MKHARSSLAATLAAVAALAVAAGPAAAEESYAYAEIDCGAGVIQVASGADFWAPLVDVKSGKKYKPVAWRVSGVGFAIDVTKKGEPKKHAVECSYSDGEATGTVTVKKA